MKSRARIFSTMAFAFFIVPALLAGDTANPADASKKDESVSSTGASATAASPAPAGKTLFPLRALLSRQGAPAGGNEKNAEKHARQAARQDFTTPKVELFVGYTYWRAVPETISNRIHAMNGASASLAYNFNRHVGLVVDIGGFKVD